MLLVVTIALVESFRVEFHEICPVCTTYVCLAIDS